MQGTKSSKYLTFGVRFRTLFRHEELSLRVRFTNQESQIGSTVLLYADVNVPCILVVTSDKRNAFKTKNGELISFAQ
jgi:hypothetical protein